MISIIVPVYNAGNYISKTIENVTAQTYTDWELLLVDDCSKDKSCEIIEEEIRRFEKSGNEKDKIRLLKQKENAGAANARNRGIDESRGRYIAFLDADDVWHPEKLEKELNFMQEKDAGFVFTAYEFGDADARPTGRIVHVPETLTFKEALSRTVIFTSTVLFDKEKIPLDLLHMPVIASEDTACWWRILKSGITAYGLEEALVIYRRPASSLSSNKYEAIKRIWGLYREIAGLNVLQSAWYFTGWAFRATARRL